MPKKRKTKQEKIVSQYRLKDFRLKAEQASSRRDVDEFGYLSVKFVQKDLFKTVLLSTLIIGLLFFAKAHLG